MPEYSAQELSVNTYVTKPESVDAMLLTEGNATKVCEWLARDSQIEKISKDDDNSLYVVYKSGIIEYLIWGYYQVMQGTDYVEQLSSTVFHEEYTLLDYPSEKIEPVGTEDGAWYSPGVINFKGVDFYSDGSDK